MSFAILAFVLFAGLLRLLYRTRLDFKLADAPPLNAPEGVTALMALSGSLPTSGRCTGFWGEPQANQDCITEAIKKAEKSIDFETFDITPGQWADEFAAVLTAAVARGVRVRLIVDAFGVQRVPKTYWHQLKVAGIAVKFFHAFDWRLPFRYNTRTHCKLLVIDGKEAYTGGQGISNDWDGDKASRDGERWLDLGIRLEGDAVGVLERVFMQHWAYVGGTVALTGLGLPARTPVTPNILVTPSDPTIVNSPVRALFQTAIHLARERLWIASPYFLPDRDARAALVAAYRRGVDVRILCVGPYNDHETVYRASRELYEELLEGDIPLFEYQPAMMHAKVLLADHWVSLGSTNFDPRSFFRNVELNVTVNDAALLDQVEGFFKQAFAKSERIDLTRWRKRHLAGQMLGRVSLMLRSQL